MAILKYISGKEHSEVIEHKNFNDSIFSDQYAQALKAIERYLQTEIQTPPKWNKRQTETLRTVAFNGQRGDGKSSCMRTVTHIIEGLSDLNESFPEDKDRKFIDELHLNKLSNTRFEILPVIDPAFFDKSHNVLEFIIGQIYRQVSDVKDKDRVRRNELMKKFEEIKSSISELNDRRPSGYDDLSDLASLAAAMNLRDEIEAMMGVYLNYMGKDKLIISIDDIDLNMECAYEMCEQLRKYLGNQHCIVLMSVKLTQLHDAIANTMARHLAEGKKGESYEMAAKYIDKLLPAAIRIAMPKMYGLSEIKLEIYPNENAAIPEYENDKVKDGVVELIFQRTRYLFYNNLSGVSPIVPSNLREVMTLLGLLISMPEIAVDHSSEDETKKLNANKLIFKEYFYSEWIQQLNASNREEILKWLKPENKTSQNKLISQYIGSWTEYSKGQRDYSDNDEVINVNTPQNTTNRFHSHFEKIVSSDNFGYNVSVGDVFHLIYLLEQDKLDSEQELMLFFIKSHYSIMLYETYDHITESLENLYPQSNPAESILYRFDERFNEVNELQRLVGSYFTYEPNELLPHDKATKESYDLKKINLETDRTNIANSKWKKLLGSAWEVLIQLSENPELCDRKERLRQVWYAEFLLLTISRNIPSGDDDNPLNSNFRKNVRPAYAQSFHSPMKEFLFDALMPFASIVNPKFAYNRFQQLFSKDEKFKNKPDFYTLALQTPDSLLRQMMTAACKRNGGVVPEYLVLNNKLTPEQSHNHLNILLSDAIIRNGEVLAAIFANLKSRRFEVRDKKDLQKIENLYKLIKNGKIATHRQAKGENPFRLEFAFLSPLMNFLQDIEDNKELHKEFLDILNQKEDTKDTESLTPDSITLSILTDYIKSKRKRNRKGSFPTMRKSTITTNFKDEWDDSKPSLSSVMDQIEREKGYDPHHDYTIEEFAQLIYPYRSRFKGLLISDSSPVSEGQDQEIDSPENNEPQADLPDSFQTLDPIIPRNTEPCVKENDSTLSDDGDNPMPNPEDTILPNKH